MGIINKIKENSDFLGRRFGETMFSPLKSINSKNPLVTNLSLLLNAF